MPLAFAIVALFAAALLFARRASAASVADDDLGEIEVTATRRPSRPAAPVSTPATSASPPGLQINNPGNLRFVPSITWRGQIGSSKRGFVVFDTALNGLRAAFINLRTAMTRHNALTIRAIITRWAPTIENPTQAYINFVATQTRLSPDTPLNFTTHAPAIMKAIVRFEQGIQPYDDAFYTQAFKAAAS